MAAADNPFVPVLIPNQNGGLNTRNNSTLVEDNQFIDGLNLVVDEPGTVGTRPGTEKIANEVSSSQTCRGWLDYTKVNGNTYLVWKCAGSLYYIQPNSTTNTSIASGLSSTEVEMGVFNDKIFISNATDDLRIWDGTTVTTNAGVPKGANMIIFESRMYITGNPTNPSQVYFSDIPAYGSDPVTFGGTSVINVNPGDNYKCTGFSISEGRLLISKGDQVNKKAGSVYQVTYNTSGVPTGAQRVEAQKGWLNSKTTSQYETSAIYLSDDSVRSIGQSAQYPAGYRDSDLSININRTIASIKSTANTLAAGLYNKSSYYLSVPYYQDVYNDIVLVYAYGAWTFWNNIYANRFIFWNGYVYFADSRRGQLWRINPDKKNDDTTAIRAYLITKHYALGSPSVRKQISGIQARLYADSNSRIRVSYSKDQGNYVKNTTWTVGLSQSGGAARTTPGIIGSYYGALDAAYGGTSTPSANQEFSTRRWSFNEKAFLFSVKFEMEQLNKGFKLINFDIISRQMPYNDYFDVN